MGNQQDKEKITTVRRYHTIDTQQQHRKQSYSMDIGSGNNHQTINNIGQKRGKKLNSFTARHQYIINQDQSQGQGQNGINTSGIDMSVLPPVASVKQSRNKNQRRSLSTTLVDIDENDEKKIKQNQQDIDQMTYSIKGDVYNSNRRIVGRKRNSSMSESSYTNPVEQDRILQKLSRRNEELRRQLKEINDQLTTKLKNKKLIPKKVSVKGNKKQNQDGYNSDEQQQTAQMIKQREIKNAGIKRQLQNRYRQLDMYKRTLNQLRRKQQTEVSTNRMRQMENQVSQLDKIINQTIKKIDGMKNIRLNQEKGLGSDLNQDLIDGVQQLKREEDAIKKKIKEINRRDTLRDNNLKRQQAYLFEVQRKLREMNGQYFPELKKKANGNGKQVNTVDDKNDKKSAHLPSSYEIKIAQAQIEALKKKHEQYHKKINHQLVGKNRLNEELSALQLQTQTKQKTIESLKSKLNQMKKILRPNKKSHFGYNDDYQGQGESEDNQGGLSQIQNEVEQDQFDIRHLIGNIPKPVRLKPADINSDNRSRINGNGGERMNSESSGGLMATGEKSQPKVWGSVMSRHEEKGRQRMNEVIFDDSSLFEGSLQPVIVGVTMWLNKNNDILALQAIYIINKDEIRYGSKSSGQAKVENGYIVRYDLKAPDFLRNISGGFSKDTGVLEYLQFHSKKGKSSSFGNKRQGQDLFTFSLASNERPYRLNGAYIVESNEPRITRLGMEIGSE